MEAIVKTIDGGEFTMTGDLVTNLYTFLTQKKGMSFSVPIMWVGDGETFINFTHVVSVRFLETGVK